MPAAVPAESRSTFFIASAVCISFVTLWLTFKSLMGYNWARILLFLGFLISLPLAIPTLITMFHISKLTVGMSVGTLLLQFLSLSLLFSEAGNSWFKEQKMMRE